MHKHIRITSKISINKYKLKTMENTLILDGEYIKCMDVNGKFSFSLKLKCIDFIWAEWVKLNLLG